MTSANSVGRVTGAVGVASIAAASVAIFVRRRQQLNKLQRKACNVDGSKTTDAVASSIYRDVDASFTPATSSGAVPASSVSKDSSLTEPWQGTGVIRALGVRAPEESIADVMAEFYEKLLNDTETKDVEIEMFNGSIYAHSLILSASSDAIKGILRHSSSTGGCPARLSWREYPVEVGLFLLRLLYTGTVADTDFVPNPHADGGEPDQVPLSILLGSFEISMVYLITHLLPTLVQAVQHRLAVDTFNSICTSAIKVDAMALRLHCLQYARSNPRKLRYEEFTSGMRVRALRQIDHEHADVPAGTVGTVQWGHGDWLDIHWSCFPGYTNGLQEVIGSIELLDRTMPGETLRQMYDNEEFSPEVQSELAAIWGMDLMKRRPRRLW